MKQETAWVWQYSISSLVSHRNLCELVFCCPNCSMDVSFPHTAVPHPRHLQGQLWVLTALTEEVSLGRDILTYCSDSILDNSHLFCQLSGKSDLQIGNI